MRVLVCSTRGAGHIGPLVPFARACAAAGDDVFVASPDESRAVVEEAGLPWRGFGDPSAQETGAVYARAPEMAPEDVNAMVIGEVFARIDVLYPPSSGRPSSACWPTRRLARAAA